MEKPAPTRETIHALLRDRWSPRAFSTHPVGTAELRRIFEAARWAPSSFNEQPWRFVVTRREDRDGYQRILDCVIAKNREWAGRAPVLALSVARTRFAASGEENRHAFHDVGLAVGQLTMQATAMGLVLHQIAGFDVEAARTALAIPEGFEPVAVLAIGYPGDPADLPEALRDKEEAARRRLPLEEIVFEGRWAQAFEGETNDREPALSDDAPPNEPNS